MQKSSREWITTKELAEIKQISERAVRKAINKKKYVTRKCSKSYEILITSLEENVREKITELEEKLVPVLDISNNIPEEQKKLALAKYDLIKKWDEYRNSKNKKTMASNEFLEMYNRGLVCENLFQQIGNVAIGTIYQWHRRLTTFDGDWHSLINNYTFGEKTKKSALSKIEEELFLKILLHPNKINIGKAIKMTKSALKERGVEQFCCDMTYRRFANSYKKEHFDTWVLAREGTKALRDKAIPYIPRDISKLEVGDVLIGDGHKLALQIINPYTGNPTRATMVAYQDWKSTALVGFEIMLDENTQCIASALRNAIINLGKVPKFCYQDNGKAFKSKYFIENGLTGLFANLGIQPIFAKPYNAKAKPIERFFREFQDSFETIFSSYVGASIDDKPAYLKRNEKFHKNIHNAFIPTIEEVLFCINKWLNFHYSQPCPNDRTRTIGEVLESGKGQGVDIDKLDDLMMVREIKNVRQNGVRFLKSDYFNEALYGYRGGVIIKYSLFDLSFIKVYTPKGKFICNANRVEPVNPLAHYIGEPKDIEELKQRTKMQKRLEEKTERKYIQQLKRENLLLPLTDMNLPEYQEEQKLIEVSNNTENKKEDNNGIFATRFERYEYLINKENLTKSEATWLKEYEESEEYQQIYSNNEAVNQ